MSRINYALSILFFVLQMTPFTTTRNCNVVVLTHPLAIHEAQNQRFTTENENGKKPSILILRLGEEGR